MSLPVTLSWGNLPANYCWTTPQQYMTDIFTLLAATVANMTGINFGNTTPIPANRNMPWMRTNPDGTPDGFYVFAEGLWTRRHPVDPSSKFRWIYMGTEAQLWSEDGGDGTNPGTTPPTDTTGAMWQRDTTFGDDTGTGNCFSFPCGIGTNPTAYDGGPKSTVSVGQRFGVERVNLDATMIPSHYHYLANTDTLNFNSNPLTGNEYMSRAGSAASSSEEYFLCGDNTVANTGITSSVGGSLSHNNLPPAVGVIFAQRTARKYYTQAA